PAADGCGMRTRLLDEGRRKRMVVMVSKFDHALLHLLYQIRVGWLDAEVAAIISNHEDFRETAAFEGVPFHYLPVGATNKLGQEQEVLRLVKETRAQPVVVGRHMQILGESPAPRPFGAGDNIHHPVLARFKSATPL